MIDAMMTLCDKSEDSDYLLIENFKLDKKYSIAVLKERIASEKDNVLWRIVLAGLYEECHMYSQTLPLLDSILEEYGFDPDILEGRADCYDDMGLFEYAIADINKALEICDEKEQAYYYARRAEINRYAGNYEASIEDVSKFIDRYPTDAYGYYARGWCKELSGDLDGALQD